MIELNDVTVIYNKGTLDERVALKDVSLNVEEGEFLIVVGPNGAGKSTLLKVFTGEVRPFSGSCKIYGKVVKPERFFSMASIVSQEPNQGVFPNLTVEENLILARKKGIRGFGFGKIDARSLDLLAFTGMGLERDLKRKAAKLSGGQKQALAMVMAVSSNPKLLLLDEHTAALDPKSTEKIMELTDKINKEFGTTIIMITHDMNIPEQYGMSVLVMGEGTICTKIDKSKESINARQLKEMIRSTVLMDIE